MEQKNNHRQLFLDALLAMDRIGSEKVLRDAAQQQQSFEAVEQIISRMLPEFRRDRKNSPKIGIGVLIDHHALGKRIVKAVVQAEGFEIFDFGDGLSVEEIVDKTMAYRIDVLLVSTLMLPSALKVKEIRQQFDHRKIKTWLIVGGAPFRLDSSLWLQVGADADGKNGTAVIPMIERLVATQ
ncbi:MAG: cobalamin-dependent protein [Firmicutes bacterium]|nr:cobalamin-dependent protein [Bacillota bacterium]